MRKILTSSLLAGALLTSSAYALGQQDGKLYIGVQYGNAVSSTSNDYSPQSVSHTSGSHSNNFSDLAIKAGYGNKGDWNLQFRVSKVTYKDPIFDTTHKDYIEVGADFIREFSYSEDAYPYIKFGIGYGTMSVDGFSSSDTSAVTYSGGLGVSYQTVKDVYVLGGIDYFYRNWDDLKYSDNTSRTTHDDGVLFYFGVNLQLTR